MVKHSVPLSHPDEYFDLKPVGTCACSGNKTPLLEWAAVRGAMAVMRRIPPSHTDDREHA